MLQKKTKENGQIKSVSPLMKREKNLKTVEDGKKKPEGKTQYTYTPISPEALSVNEAGYDLLVAALGPAGGQLNGQ